MRTRSPAPSSSTSRRRTAGSCKQVFGKGTPGEVDALFKFARALDFALILLVVGGAARRSRSSFARRPPRCRPASTGSSPGSRSASSIGALCIVLQGAVAGGFGLSEAFRWNTVDSVLQTHFGKAFLFQLAFAAVVCTGGIHRRTRPKRSAGRR